MPNNQRQFIASQYAEECAFLWATRDAAVQAPHYTLADLTELDERIEAQLDGLRVMGERGISAAKAELHWDQPGEFFTASVLAIENQKIDELESLVGSMKNPRSLRGMVSAFGWCHYVACEPLVKSLLTSNEAVLTQLGLAACSVNRRAPMISLTPLVRHENANVRARALRLVGEINNSDLLNELKDTMQDDNAYCRYWANWSIALLGDPVCLAYFQQPLSLEPELREAALNIALRIMKHSDAIALVRSIGQSESPERLTVSSTGILGDPASIPWLLEKMNDTPLARVSSEAFTNITGVDILTGFDISTPEYRDSLDSEDTQNSTNTTMENTEIDLDDDLPWPDVEKLSNWWEQNKSLYNKGQRYFLGNTLSGKACRDCLTGGYQRQRSVAALELAIKTRDSGLFETRAPALAQQRQLFA